jgi:hypothetical protein
VAGSIARVSPTLSISTEKVCFVVLKGREFDVKDADTSEGDDGSDPPDGRMAEVLEDRPDDPVEQELTGFIDAMSEDEQVDLVTMAWPGLGTLEDWDDLRDEDTRVHNKRTAILPARNPAVARLPGRGTRGVRPFLRKGGRGAL